MGIFSVSLPVGEPSRAVPFWLDVIAAGVAVAAFSIFFSTPLRMLGWPVVIGMLAHAMRWGALKAGAGVTTGAWVACLLAGGIFAPEDRQQIDRRNSGEQTFGRFEPCVGSRHAQQGNLREDDLFGTLIRTLRWFRSLLWRWC